jgi:hypothetical protein
MNNLISITILVFAFLQISLFFKLWGMANNVKKISSKQLSFLDNKRIEEAQICLLKNESEKALDLYRQAFFMFVSDLYNKTLTDGSERKKEYWTEHYAKIVRFFTRRLQNFDNSIDFSVYDTFDKVEQLIIRK